jgi:hypothetical protein
VISALPGLNAARFDLDQWDNCAVWENPYGSSCDMAGNTMALEFESERERQLHQATATHLAREMRVTEDRVLEAYARELEQLQRAARLRTFLPVLAAKHVKAFFRREERLARQGSAYRFA